MLSITSYIGRKASPGSTDNNAVYHFAALDPLAWRIFYLDCKIFPNSLISAARTSLAKYPVLHVNSPAAFNTLLAPWCSIDGSSKPGHPSACSSTKLQTISFGFFKVQTRRLCLA
jgi:hypothetical protein